MPTAPANPEIETAKPAPKIVTWLGGTDASEALATGETTVWRPLQITRRAGGSALDTATFAYDHGAIKRGSRITECVVTIRTSQVQVRMLDEDDEPTGQAIAWGVISNRQLEIGRDSEREAITVRIDPHHFGNICRGYKVWDPLDSEATEIDEDIWFNPQIDGIIEGNRSTKTTTTDAGTAWKLWLDPESVRRGPAETLQGATASQWTMTDAVLSLCSLLNPQELYITNPTSEYLETIFDPADPPNPFNLRFPRGQYLPYYLDSLLEPYGFGWFIKLGFDDAGVMTRTIALFQRGVGENREILLQSPGEQLDLAETNLTDFGTDCSIADLANVVTGAGSKQEREVTIELYRGWPVAEDAFKADQLDRTWKDSEFWSHPNAWRLWVANEAGDYTGTRASIDQRPINGPLDLSDVFDLWVPRRRRIDDCLTKDADFRRRPPFIEWYDGAEPVEANRWKPIEPGSVTILNDQIGIYFTGATPPAYISDQDYFARVRITGTVQGDSRLTVRKTRRDTSINKLSVELFLDVSDRFHDREVQQTGTYASVLNAEAYGADERDDETALDTFVTNVQSVEDAAAMRGQFALHGLSFEYEIGDCINRVAGRRITLDRMSHTDPEERFMQVTGIQYDMQGHRTTLEVESLASKAFTLDPTLGGV